MIDIKKLTNNDVGKWVVYNPGYTKEIGKIKSWNDKFIFVVYNCANDWDNFMYYTGAATFPKDLFFINKGV
jgi:hypothetical protein